MKRKASKKITLMITIFALMLLMIPAGVLFADTIAGNTTPSTSETTIKPESSESEEPSESEEQEDLEDPDESEAPELDEAEVFESEESEQHDETGEPEESSEQAAIVAERIAAAEALGMTPGHLNLIDRLAAISGKTRPEVLAEFPDASVQTIMKEIKRCREAARETEATTEPTEGTEDNSQGNHSSNGHAYGKNK